MNVYYKKYKIKKGEYEYTMEENKFWIYLESIIKDIRDNSQNSDIVKDSLIKLNKVIKDNPRNLS